MEFLEGAGFVGIVIWILTGLVKVLWNIFFRFPAWIIKKVSTGVIALFHKGFYVSVIAIAVVLVLGTLTGIADISTGGQVNNIVKHGSFSQTDTTGIIGDNVHFSDDGFGYNYSRHMALLLKLPVFTTQFSSPIVGRVGSGLFISSKDSIHEGYGTVFLAALFAFLEITLYFLVYDALFGFIVIGIGVTADVIIHAVRR